jgi:Zn finger protein HypA/HybF involved in hydrogenase expression
MHELAIREDVPHQVLDVAAAQKARHIGRITLHIRPSAGVESDLVRLAVPLIAGGTPCEASVLEIGSLPVQTHCHACGTISQVLPNRLRCEHCAGWRVDLVSGGEFLLAGVELLDHVSSTLDAGFC